MKLLSDYVETRIAFVLRRKKGYVCMKIWKEIRHRLCTYVRTAAAVMVQSIEYCCTL
jgi:hypothetical protein